MADQGTKGRRWDLGLFACASLMGRMEELPLTSILSFVLGLNPSWFISRSSDTSPEVHVCVRWRSPLTRVSDCEEIVASLFRHMSLFAYHDDVSSGT